MQKFVSFLLAGALAAESLLMPVSALAQTATSTANVDALIVQLEAQIAALKTQIEALRVARAQVQTTAQSTFDIIRQLQLGMSGDDVRLLQILLAADADIYPEGLVTGFYGRLTSEAVKRFQRKFGLSQVGRVGPMTLEKLKDHHKDKKIEREDDDDDDDDDNDGIRGEGRSILCYRILSGINVPPGWQRKDREGKQFIKKCGDFATTTPPVIPPAPPPPPAQDTTAPVISDITSTSTTAIATTIKWSTNEFATGHVWYGLTAPFTLFNGSNILVKDHSVNISGLSASTTYQFVTVSKDLAGNTATSSQQSVTTQ